MNVGTLLPGSAHHEGVATFWRVAIECARHWVELRETLEETQLAQWLRLMVGAASGMSEKGDSLMKKMGMVAVLIAAALGIPACGGGSSANPCQQLADALNMASKGNGCSALATAAMTYSAEAANCPSAAVDASLVSCYSTCIGKLTDCTSTSAETAYATCIGGCKP
jgi:hypothetical protein